MNRIDALQNMYNEHATQARQHEDQRERMTNLIAGITTVLVGLITYSKLSIYSLPSALLLLYIGIHGWRFSLKHYERNRLHVRILKEVRKEIDLDLGLASNPTNPTVSTRNLEAIRKAAEEDHYKHHPAPPSEIQIKAANKIARSRLYRFWSDLPLVAALIGAGLSIAITIHYFYPIHIDQPPTEVRLVN